MIARLKLGDGGEKDGDGVVEVVVVR